MQSGPLTCANVGNMTAGLLPPLLLWPTGLPEVSLFYALALSLLAAFWLGRVAREARRGRVPRVGWWFVPGLLTLLLARVGDLAALFGIGASLLLLAEYWPGAYARPQRRPRLAWPLAGLLLALGLLTSSLLAGQANLPTVFATLLSLLTGLAGLLAAALFPRPARREEAQGFALRWQQPQLPEWPEFSVTLTRQGAQLTNTSPQPLKVVGWSPRSINGWLPPRGEEGRPLDLLASGQSAFLPLSERETGVRVWYVAPQTPAQTRLFRADWTPSTPHTATPTHLLN